MKQFLSSITLVCAAMAPVPARAQPGASVPESERIAHVELGAGFGLAGFLGEGGMAFPSASARVNITRGVAIDATAGFNVGPYSDGLSGFYLLQAHHTFPSRQRVSPFVTYGVLGSFVYRHEPEYRYTLKTGDLVIHPAYTERTLTRPFAVLGGGGARVRIAPHVYVETAAELAVADGGFIAVLRVGATIPIGGGK